MFSSHVGIEAMDADNVIRIEVEVAKKIIKHRPNPRYSKGHLSFPGQ